MRRWLVCLSLLLSLPTSTLALDPTLFQELRYRLIGPFRASRTVGGVGVPSQPNVFYVGVNNGGVWKTDDYGRTWEPIFDDAPTGSSERELTVRLDPRVELSRTDLDRQTSLSMRCYRAYERAQEIREAIDAKLAAGGPTSGRLRAFRGERAPGDPDILYGSIYATPPEEETVTSLQHKLLFVLKLLQGADARPTEQAEAAVVALEESLEALRTRAAAE